MRTTRKRYADNLYLQTKGGARSWLFRYTRDGKAHWLGLGSYPAVKPAEAKAKTLECRSNLSRGLEPRPTPAPSPQVHAPLATLAEASRLYLEAKATQWKGDKHRRDWQTFMGHYVLSHIGQAPVADITTDMVMSVVANPSRARSVLDQRVRQRLWQVLSYATARGWRDGPNPARWSGHLEHLLPMDRRRRAKRHRALPYLEVPALMTLLSRRYLSNVAAALRFAILTGTRSGEVRMAVSGEISLVDMTWTIPPERTKTGETHRVPLTKKAVDCIGWGLEPDPGRLLFAGVGGKPINPSSMTSLLKRLDYRCTVHGFRSSFRDWVAEETDYLGELAEIALAHSVVGKVEGAYRRGDQLEKRRPMMQAWSDYCSGSRSRLASTTPDVV